ncbi:MAG TPA: 4'-phosphopantetheinyl transferase superfamily protein [Chthoniobacterales bacterium]
MTICNSEWRLPPEGISVTAGELHIWRAFLNDAKSRLKELSRFLSYDERERAGRFRFARDREHFIVSRAILRILLHRYVGTPAGDIQFGYGANGKPYFADETHRWLRFNLSHSHGVALYAISAEREIGIDVEYVGGMPDVDVENIFSASEIAALKALPESVRPRAFFACWTRKEAYIKARGGGLSIPLKSFSVSLSPGEPAALLDASPPEFSRWSLREIAVDPRYAAAVAVEGSPSRIRYWEVRESDF